MGVDFFDCRKCGDSVCDCGEYWECKKCGERWCSSECARADGGKEGDEYYRVESCAFCRKEDVDDSELVKFLLKNFKLTRKKAVKLYNEMAERTI